MNEEIICSVCWDTFKFPKLLPCKHTFCLSCLHEFLEGLQDKSNLVCPLYREPCYVPEKGFSDFPTNYFVPVEKIAKHCQECKRVSVLKVCYPCNAFLCHKCDVMHSHTKRQAGDEEEDSVDDDDVGLPFHLRWPLMHTSMKTEFLCKQISMFVVELPAEIERTIICALAFSRSGGVYVNRERSEYLLKYDKQGRVIDRIELLDNASSVLETRRGLLLVAHYGIMTTVCYGDVRNRMDIKYAHFATRHTFFPLGMSELRNGNIVIGGPTHLCSNTCKDKQCELRKNSHGIITVFTQNGIMLKEIVQDGKEYIFEFPHDIASSSRFDTIAVCDTGLQRIIVLDYEGKVQASYKGWGNIPFPLFPESEKFLPLSLCSTPDGNYVVGDLCRECLHVLSPYGKFIGILRCEDGEILNEARAMCVDSVNNIWIGHNTQGTVSVLKPSRFRNVFDRLNISLTARVGT